MKLFGSKKDGKHSVPAAVETAPEELQESVIPTVEPAAEGQELVQVPEFPMAPAGDEEVPVISELRPAEQLSEESEREETPDDGFISSIAEAFGVPAESLQNELPGLELQETVKEESAAEVAEKDAAAPVEVDKKAAKKAAKAEKKAAKKAAKKEKKEAKKWSAGKKVLVALLLVFAILLSCGAGYIVTRLWVTQKSMGIYAADYVEPERNLEENPDDIVQSVDSEDQDAQVVDSDRKEGCYTFMVAGRDVQSGCTDVVIVGRMDTVNGTLNMVSIPRDTLINKGLLKINTAYQGNLAEGGDGITGLLKEVKKIVGFDIDSWAVVDTEAVARLIDAVGGVYFDVPIDMVYNDYAQNLFINIPKGYQHLSGEDAVKVLRYRKGYANGDLGRIQTQHDLLLALAEQTLDVKNIPNLGEAINIYQECVHSNLSAGNLVFYAKEFLKLDFDKIQFIDMPQCKGGIVQGQSFIFINPSKWLNVINNYLNPYKEDITAKNLSIKTSYDSGATFAYTAGAGS